MYSENNKTPMKEVSVDNAYGKIYCAHGLEKLILLKFP